METEVDLERFRAGGLQPPKKPNPKKPKQTNPFVRGPIPLVWIARAANIPRRNALTVGIVLWWLAGMRLSRIGIVLSVKRCESFGLGRKAVERGLRDLAMAGLVRVIRKRGRAAKVDLLEPTEVAQGGIK